MAIFGQFTDRTQRVLTAARKAALELHQARVDSLFLLFGLLSADNPPPSMASLVTAEDVKKLLTPGPSDTEPERYEMAPDTKRLLERSMLEARRLGQLFVTPEHLWLSILRIQDNRANQALQTMGINTAQAIAELEQLARRNDPRKQGIPHAVEGQPAAKPQEEGSALERFSRDLTQAAQEGKLDPVVGRETEIQRMVQILIRRTKNNPVLIGEPGVGKSAVVEGLAQRIVQHNVPEMLLNKRLLMLDISSMVAGSKYRGEFEERLKNVMA